jgi:hypothetical protein
VAIETFLSVVPKAHEGITNRSILGLLSWSVVFEKEYFQFSSVDGTTVV